MRKKQIIWVLGLTGLLLVAGIAYLQFFRLPWTRLDAREAVPAQAALFFQFTSEQTPYSVFSEKLAELPSWTPGESDAQSCMSLTDTLAEQFPDARGGELLVVLQAGGARNFNLLIAMESKNGGDVYEWLRGWKGVQETVFRKHPILTIPTTGENTFCLSRYRNLLIWAPFAFQVEDALRQLDDWKTALPRQAGFKQLTNLLPVSDSWQLFLNPGHLQGQFAPFLEVNNREAFSWLEGIDSWWTLQVKSDSTAVSWTGAVAASDGIDFFEKLQPIEPEPFDQLSACMPADMAFAWGMQMANCPLLSGKIPAEAFFNRFLQPHLTGFYVLSSPVVRSIEDRQAWAPVTMVKDSTAWNELVDGLTEKAGLLQDYAYQTYRVRQVLADIAFPFPGQQASIRLNNPFFVRINDFVLWAASRSAVERWLDQYLMGQTLGLQDDFLRLRAGLDSASVSWMYGNPLEAASRLDPYLTADAGVVLESMRSAPPFFLHLWPDGACWRLEARQAADSSRQSSPAIAWKCGLETEAAIRPQVFKETATGDICILVQDVEERLYMLDENGELRWTRRLDGRIISDIEQLDLFRSGEIQFVFNTKDGIFLIDKQGNDLRNFPLPLQSSATNGLLLVDESGRGDYLLFVACQNGSVYGYDLEGRPLPGWNPLEGIGRVVHPLGFFQASQKDFLYLLNQRGLLQAYSKKGAVHFDSLNTGAGVISAPQHQVDPQSTRIVTVDRYGKGLVVNQEGTSFRLNLSVGSSDFVQFRFADLLGDSRKEYIVWSGRDLTVFTYQKNNFKKAWTYRFPYAQDELFLLPSGNQYPLVGTLSTDRKKIFVLDAQGHLLPGFPLAGATACSSLPGGRDGSVLVLTGLEDAVYGYGVNSE